MKLQDLLYGVAIKSLVGQPDIEVADLALDSRAVKNGTMFFAIKGTAVDGHEFIAQTAKAGAWRTGFDKPQDFRRGTGSATAVAQRGTNAPGACIIKGNINGKGEKIYHLPGQSGYQQVKEESMFCTIAEAEAAGFRARRR